LQDPGWGWLAIISLIFFIVPVVILICIYLRIFAVASKSSRGIRRNSAHYPLCTNLLDGLELEGAPDKDQDELVDNNEAEVRLSSINQLIRTGKFFSSFSSKI
jgi:hypothetical protein